MECMRNQLVEGRVLNGRYETISPLNHGSFGMVFTARDLQSGDLVAIKCLTKSTGETVCPTSGFAVDDQSEEVAIHHKIDHHPHIVNLVQSFETDHHIYLVLEFCSNGDLYEAIRLGKGPLETEHVRDFMLQLVGAVEYLHARGIYHRDIKPENIFLTASGSMKLGDFGLATTEHWNFESAVGSDRYMAPEQYDVSVNGYSPAKADVWAIGICLLNVLFSRNPFATPTISDPLFSDFAADRQSLFDVFPNMSQDAYEVLTHSLAIDPNKRSLSAVREALERAVNFTTDDETLDDFCTDNRDVIPATLDREPLRTPSISSPQVDTNGSFPWAKALAMSPPQQIRQLSTIKDTEIYEDGEEEMFPSNQDWYGVKRDSASAISFVDSGLGVSYKSHESSDAKPMDMNRSKPVTISGSLPINFSKGPTLSSVLGKKRDFGSKSWSDLWDEEEEEHASSSETENDDVTPMPTNKAKIWGRESESGVSTPRAGLSEMNAATVNNSRNRSPVSQSVDHRVSELTGFIFEDHATTPHVAKYSPPSKRSPMDRWAKLGDLRRGVPTPKKDPLPKKEVSPIKEVSSPPRETPRKRSRAASWRRQLPWVGSGQVDKTNNKDSHGLWERKDWSASREWLTSNDWRRHNNLKAQASQYQPGRLHDDIGDLEWVGGWNDLHL
ncbi:kinase-like protein [Pseudovirgaria hyperparasitica]|uniref:Kinase-like protein n=1 Tax=Pseudovirgaria hyperparasitica TaxID=470096 RepID=A0A6A6VZU0_9PEZI|nr:kinase-like protein [Pseudovirgaria hyperparasitica]KAF2755366.1 kinase-like protein [Pseudovirgaria hyperparasitica]